MEAVIEKMRKDVRVELDKSREEVTNAFRIFYRGRDPRSTQLVAGELAGKYVSAQMEEANKGAQTTNQFFDQQLMDAQNQLNEIDRKRLQFMQQNVGNLPTESSALLGQLSSLSEQQKALTTEYGRLRDQRIATANQLSEIQQQSGLDKIDVIENLTDPKTTAGYGNLMQRKAQLEAEYQNMLTTLKPANPDVKAKKAEIDAVQREMDQVVNEDRVKKEELKKRVLARPDLRIGSLKDSLMQIDNELVRQQRLMDQNGAQIAQITQRLNLVPGAEVTLGQLDREYQTKKLYYDDLLQKKQKAALSGDVQTNAQGETLQVVDPANLPQKPVAPKRAMLILMGVGLGLLVGLIFAAAFEVPRLMTIQTSSDAEHYTGLPLLVTVPEMLTPQESRRLTQRRLLLTAAGIILTIVSIPALALALRMSGLFDRFIS
jgi:uncharacterized protein involved in exopolysaccharide biosynthesis